jgi:Phage portal protein
MQLQHFTEGNVPPGLITAPDGWNAEQIRQFQEWFDAVLAGNTAARSRLVWAPGGAKYQAFKEAPYKDDFDEWLARIVCYAFSLPATPLIRQINRATADTAQEAALAEGLAPLMGWVKRLADHVIQDRMGETDLEFAWSDLKTIEPKEQAELLALYVKEGIKTRNEARSLLGDDPLPGGDALTVDTPHGPLPLNPSPAMRERVPEARSARAGEGNSSTAPSAKRWAGEVGAGVPLDVPHLTRTLSMHLAKDGFDPDQPRVPAGAPDGGQWTGEGGEGQGDAASDGSNGTGPPLHDYPESQDAEEGRVWERFPNPEFRNRLAIAEQTADKPDFGYTEAHYGPNGQIALGRYQMTRNGLNAAGMIDAHGDWTGKYGIQSAEQFLANPAAQEKALSDFLSDTERQLRTNGSFDYLGKRIDGRVATFTVTRAGLIAAGHREGARETCGYLQSFQNSGFSSTRANLTREDLRVETRLRTFSNAGYE